MIKILKILILFCPHFTSAGVCLILGQNISNDITSIKDNITDCIENTFPRASLYLENGESEPQLRSFSLPAGDVTRNRKNLKKIVKFFLYTPELNSSFEILEFNNSTSLAKSHFNPNRPTRFVTHGYTSSGTGPSCELVREAYLNFTNSNVIVIDWSQLACDFYPVAAFYVKLVGEHVGKMLTFMEKKGMNPKTTTLVGHSLGAHVMGIASSSAAQKVKYIYGLDPAMPCFLNAHSGERISPDDAEFVEVIHTSEIGDNQTLGDYDFYPNGGKNQPKCACQLVMESACSHSTSFEYFAESLNMTNPPFYSVLCKNLNDFLGKKCEKYEAIMGGIDRVPKRKGHYFLYTRATSPYSLGRSYKDISCSTSQSSMCFFKIINYLFGAHLCYG